MTIRPIPRPILAEMAVKALEAGIVNDIQIAGIVHPRVSSLTVGGDTFLDQAECGWADEDTVFPVDLWRELVHEIESLGLKAGSAGFIASQLCTRYVQIGAHGYPTAMREQKDPRKALATKAIRSSVFGGRQELFRTRANLNQIVVEDLSAAYVRLLSTPLPFGSGYRIDLGHVSTIHELCSERRDTLVVGGWEVDEREPHAPQPLPYRDADGATCYPHGRWYGCYWASEAHTKCVRLVKPLAAWSFQLSPWLRILGDLLLEMRERSVFPAFWKIVGNRCAGNLAAEGPKKKVIAAEDAQAGDFPVFSDLFLRITAPQPRSYARIPAYSSITSRCRVMLRRAMVGRLDDLLAVHTDGMYLMRKRDIPFPPASGTLPAVWREKEAVEMEFGKFIGLGAGTWYAQKLGCDAPAMERRTGVAKQLPWSEVTGGDVRLGLGDKGRLDTGEGRTKAPRVEEF